MRIGVDCYAIQHPASAERGIGRYSRDLLRAILEADRGEDEFALYAVEGLPTEAIPSAPNATVRTIRPRMLNQFTSAALGDHLLDEGDWLRIDALLLLSPLQSNVVPHRTVYSVFYDAIPEVFPEIYLGPSPGYREAYEECMKLLYRYDHLLTMSEHAKTDLTRRRGIDPRKITCIGADANPRFRPARDQAERDADKAVLRSLGLFGDFILNVGHTDSRKGTARLAEAYALLPEDLRSRYQLVFAYAAPPSHRHEMLRLAGQLGLPNAVGDPAVLHELGMSPRLIFTDWVNDDALVALYRSAAVHVFPSLYEGFGLPLLEGMRCGCPTIAGNNSSQPEVVGRGGVLVDPTDPAAIARAMREVLSNDAVRRYLSAMMLDRAMEWPRWPAVAEKALGVLRG